MRDVGVVIPAGGTGTRLGGQVPKQFRRLGGTSILSATISHFTRHPRVFSIAVAAPAPHVARTRQLVRGARLQVVAGGPVRQESVWRGLGALRDPVTLVIVHDAVRPFITRALIDAVLQAAVETGAAICALPVTETVKRVRDGLVEETVERASLWTVQTPQAFDAALLREAHEKAIRDGVVATDDAALVERLGQRVRVVPGLPGNVKITTVEDLRRARAEVRR